MNDRILIFTGLAIFILAATFPFWQSVEADSMPQISMETKGDQCVAPVEYMRNNHMQLLNDWRDSVVRDGERFHIMPDGSKVEKSLTKTCLGCHVSQKNFCEECHSYASVKPYCWECHVIPVEGGVAQISSIGKSAFEDKELLQNLIARNQQSVIVPKLQEVEQ